MATTTEAARTAGAKTPDDKKKPHHKKSERFTFTNEEGAQVSAIYVENIPYRHIEAFGKMPSDEAQEELINVILSEEDAQKLRAEFTYGEVGEFFDQWNEESAIKLGGIARLVDVLEDYGEAIEYELIRLGLRLRDLPSRTFDWRDLWVIIKNLPDNSALHRELEVIDEDSIWTPEMMLTAEILDLTAYLVWFQTKDGQSGRNRPKPYPRPGYRPKKEEYAPLPSEEMLEWLGWTAPDDIGELEEVMAAEERRQEPRTRTKLTEDDVRAIRADTITSQAALAARFGVSASTVAAVITRRTWRHVN